MMAALQVVAGDALSMPDDDEEVGSEKYLAGCVDNDANNVLERKCNRADC